MRPMSPSSATCQTSCKWKAWWVLTRLRCNKALLCQNDASLAVHASKGRHDSSMMSRCISVRCSKTAGCIMRVMGMMHSVECHARGAAHILGYAA